MLRFDNVTKGAAADKQGLQDVPKYNPVSGGNDIRTQIITSYNYFTIELAKGYLVGAEYDYIRTWQNSGAVLQTHVFSVDGIVYF